MPTAAEWFLLLAIVAIIFAAFRLISLGDALGRTLRRLFGRRDR